MIDPANCGRAEIQQVDIPTSAVVFSVIMLQALQQGTRGPWESTLASLKPHFP